MPNEKRLRADINDALRTGNGRYFRDNLPLDKRIRYVEEQLGMTHFDDETNDQRYARMVKVLEKMVTWGKENRGYMSKAVTARFVALTVLPELGDNARFLLNLMNELRNRAELESYLNFSTEMFDGLLKIGLLGISVGVAVGLAAAAPAAALAAAEAVPQVGILPGITQAVAGMTVFVGGSTLADMLVPGSTQLVAFAMPIPIAEWDALKAILLRKSVKQFAEGIRASFAAPWDDPSQLPPPIDTADLTAKLGLGRGKAATLITDIIGMAVAGYASGRIMEVKESPGWKARMDQVPADLRPRLLGLIDGLREEFPVGLTIEKRVPVPKPPLTTTSRLERVISEVKGAGVKPVSPTTPVLKQIYRTFQGQAEVQRRGVVSDVRARELAARLGVTAEDLARILPGTAANVEKMFGTMDVVKRDTASLINYVQNKELSQEAKRLEVLRHAKSVMALLGEAAEAGRALRVLRYQDPLVRVIKDLTDDVRDWKEPPDQVIDQVVKLIQGMDTTDPWDLIAAEKLLRKSGQAKFFDKLYFVWLNFILSNPTTHAVNITSNEITQLASVPENELASVIAKIRGKGQQQLGEGVAQLLGFKRALKDTLLNMDRIPSELQGVGKLDVRQDIKLPLGAEKVVGIPTALLSKEDLIAKSIVYYDEVYRLAWRQAMKEGLEGRAFAQRVEELYAQPTSDMIKDATAAAFERTFNDELTGVMKKVMELRNAMPGARWILPFVRTPYNIAVYGLKRTPLGFTKLITMAKERSKLQAAGTWSQSREVAYQTEVNKVLAAGITGMVAELVVYWLVHEGFITGSGPTDKNKRDALVRQGWQQYSFKIGNRYYSYFRLEPGATVIGLAADAGELSDAMTEDEKLKVWTKIFGSFRNNLTNKTFLSGLIDFSSVLSDTDRYGPRWLQRWAGSVIPGAVVNVRGTTDPQEREARTLLDAIRNRVPGWEAGLPARRNVWGEPMAHPEPWYVRAISPVGYTEAKPDPVEAELAKIGYDIGMPSDKLGDRKMTPEQYEQFLKLSGPSSKTALLKLFSSKEYTAAGLEDKRRKIRKTIDDIRDAAKDQMLGVVPKTSSKLGQAFGSKLPKLPPTKKSAMEPPDHPVMPGYK
jgi:hypothetical protein